MGRLRRFAETALTKLDEHNERSQAKALEKLTPAEREHYDAWVERTEHFRETGEVQEGKLVGKALLGPAGEALHGVRKAPKPPAADRRPGAARGRRRRRSGRPVPAARAPYVAAGRAGRAAAPLLRPRPAAAARRDTGWPARPDLVYGVYRVPDGNVDEWEVVHAAAAPLPPAPAPADVYFEARKRWVDRRVGEPRPDDEEIALAYLARAGSGRSTRSASTRAVQDRDPRGRREQLASWRRSSGRPRLPPGPPGPACEPGPLAAPGVRIDRLNWEAVAQAVAPVRRDPEPVPSPWPYLPLTSGELLQSYLEVVGIAPGRQLRRRRSPTAAPST